MTYSMDLRQRVVAAVNDGLPIAQIARRFGIERSTVRDWSKRAKADNLTPGKPGPTGPVKLTPADMQLIRQAVASRPGVTARELMPRLSVSVVESTVCRAFARLGLSRKKRV